MSRLMRSFYELTKAAIGYAGAVFTEYVEANKPDHVDQRRQMEEALEEWGEEWHRYRR